MKVEEAVSTNGRQGSGAGKVVVAFLDALVEGDAETALELIDDDLVYTNVSLPTIRGRRAFAKGAERFRGMGFRFDYVMHRMAETGGTVLTERTDALSIGPVRTQLWVCGTFEVNDGTITLWRDYFDWASVAVGLARGLVGAVVPSLRPTFSKDE